MLNVLQMKAPTASSKTVSVLGDGQIDVRKNLRGVDILDLVKARSELGLVNDKAHDRAVHLMD